MTRIRRITGEPSGRTVSSTLVLALALLGGCGESGNDPVPADAGRGSADGGEVSSDEPAFSDSTDGDPGLGGAGSPVTPPAALLAIEADPDRIAAVPEIVEVETLADSGLQIAYTDPSQRARVTPPRVGVQWQHMQSCLAIVATPPLVLVRVEVDPFTATDDVIRDVEGRVSASASELVDGVAILQVRDAPFDGSHADAGFGLLRQIMGRHLWFSAGLLERFYPSGCAREVPPGPLSRPPLSRPVGEGS